MRIPDKYLPQISAAIAQGKPLPVIPKTKYRKNEESAAQCEVIKWWDANCEAAWGLPPFVLFAVPNGGHRSPITGSRLKREGLRRGIPDLFLTIPVGEKHGLYIEMKTERNAHTDEQKVILPALAALGYRVETCRSTDQAKTVIINYLVPVYVAHDPRPATNAG